jgi:hypothetical protein
VALEDGDSHELVHPVIVKGTAREAFSFLDEEDGRTEPRADSENMWLLLWLLDVLWLPLVL